MIVGKLNSRIAILQPVDISDGQGGQIRSWELCTELWAHIKPNRDSVINFQGGQAGSLIYDITVRRVLKNDDYIGFKVKHNNDEYEVINSIPDLFNGTILKCRSIKRKA